MSPSLASELDRARKWRLDNKRRFDSLDFDGAFADSPSPWIRRP